VSDVEGEKEEVMKEGKVDEGKGQQNGKKQDREHRKQKGRASCFHFFCSVL
jgi:hypothetical protein